MQDHHHLLRRMFRDSAVEAIRMLIPKIKLQSPIMVVAYMAAMITTIDVVVRGVQGRLGGLDLQVTFWLWATILFSNFAEALAHSRGKARRAAFGKARVESTARQIRHGVVVKIPSSQLNKGDLIVCEAGDIIPADGEVVEGIATVDESAITGESAPVIREASAERNLVTGGTKIVSDRVTVRVKSDPWNGFVDRMMVMVEEAVERRKTPQELMLQRVLISLAIVTLIVVASLKLFADYVGAELGQDLSKILTVPVLSAAIVGLMPTTACALLKPLRLATIDRLLSRNIVTKTSRAVEAAGSVDLILLDKSGTITVGNRIAAAFFPLPGVTEKELARIAQLASLSDETPEGRSVVVLAKALFGFRAQSLDSAHSKFVAFSPATRMSGVDFLDDHNEVTRSIRKGAVQAIKAYVQRRGGSYPAELDDAVKSISKTGGTPLLVCNGKKILGMIHLKDTIKGGLKERFAGVRTMGIRTLMVTGDNPFTAAAIAAEAGVDDYIAEVTPEMKLKVIQREQESGRSIALSGYYNPEAPALAQADVGLALHSGTQICRDAANMIDLDNNPIKLIEIVEIGKSMLMARGALLTFTIVSGLAKWIALLPAFFGGLYPGFSGPQGHLAGVNVLRLHSPLSAILSTTIFSALTIVAFTPLVLKGVRYRPRSAEGLLRVQMLVYGLGGLIVPFLGIKVIDMILAALK